MISRKFFGPVGTVAVIALLAATLWGCAVGRDFPQPANAGLVMGNTFKAQIVAKFGPPKSAKSETRTLKIADGAPATANPTLGRHDVLTYSFVNPSGQASSGVSPQRGATFHFWNDMLVAFSYTSSFSADSTDFSEAAVYQIKRGQSTEADVVRLLGPPSGRAIYPFTARPGDEVLEYFNFEWNTGRGQHTARRLSVFLGTDLVVQDYRYDSSTEAIQRPSGTVPYFVTVPRGK
jgi:hypothetical protein